ncbi:hypothetical protein BGZ54_006546 [Gamsiella multidivaricata]|nr:hypothetical protein BGZ54_006546 [Gamsiella multidivaricata]
MADGAAVHGTDQIYLAEAASLSANRDEKRHADLFKLKRDMKDSWISQMREIITTTLPPSRLTVFGSASYRHETSFFAMDFAGVFRLCQIGAMIIPTKQANFANSMRSCVTACLDFVLMMSEQLNERQACKTITYKERLELEEACDALPTTSSTPVKEIKKRKAHKQGPRDQVICRA